MWCCVIKMSSFLTYTAIVLVASPGLAVGVSGGIGRLPAMGWNSWNEYACDISEEVFLETGELMVSLGLRDLGYEYVNIDDCWSDKEKKRDEETKRIVVDSLKFPRGISYVADEIHKLGLKVGIYSDAGEKSALPCLSSRAMGLFS